MPIYEYYCQKCQHEFEELVFGDDCPPCPKCGTSHTEKLMSRPCRHSASEGAGYGGDYSGDAGGGGGGGSACAGCSGGNCATCH